MKDVSDEFLAKDLASERKPIYIYDVWHDLLESEYWYFASGDTAIVYNGNTYNPGSIQHGALEFNGELNATTLEIQVANIVEPFAQFLIGNPIEKIWVKQQRLFIDQVPYQVYPRFIGLIKNVSIKGASMNVSCESLESYLEDEILEEFYQRTCGNTLYDDNCQVVKEAYAVNVLVNVDYTYAKLSSPVFGQYGDGYFTYGYIVVESHRRMIIAHKGNTIYLAFPISHLPSGTMVTAYAGCDKQITTCFARFNNVVNFKGEPDIPNSNPVTWSGGVTS